MLRPVFRYPVRIVPGREDGIDFTRIASPSDYVCMPLVRRQGDRLDWLTNRILDIPAEGSRRFAPHANRKTSKNGRGTKKAVLYGQLFILRAGSEPVHGPD